MNLESGILQIPIEDIIPNRFQPRLNFDEKALQELADSIKEHGIIQPLVLRKLGDKYEIIAGERRYKAAQMAGLTTVPAVINNVDDNEAAERAIVENVQRSDLTAIEEARSYKNLLDKGYLTQEQLAKKMGLSQPAVANKLRLLNLDEEVQQALLDEQISERHARTLLSIKDKEEQKEWLHRILNERLTVRQLDLELKKAQEEKNLMGIDDENEEVPLVESAASVDDIRANAVDINNQSHKMSTEDIMKPQQVVNEELETLDVDIPKPEMNDEPIVSGIDDFKTFDKDEEDDSTTSDVPGGFSNENDSFVTATKIPESNIVTPESTSSFVEQDNFNHPNNNSKFFSFEGPSEPEPEKDLVPASNETPFNDNFEVYNEPTLPGMETRKDSETNPFNDPEPKRPEPMMEEPKSDLNTAFDVNPNNKFFKPVYDTNTMADIKMENENERIVDPMANIDKITPEYKAHQQEIKAMNLKDAIAEIRSTIERLGDNGLYINVEEIDFDTNYQITIQIKKDE